MEKNKGLLGLVLLTFAILSLTSAVSAISVSYDYSNVNNDNDNDNQNNQVHYPKVSMKDGGFLGIGSTKVIDVELMYNTDFCDSTCFAILKLDLKKKRSAILNDILFRKEMGNKLSYIPDSFNSEILILQNVTHYRASSKDTGQVRCESVPTKLIEIYKQARLGTEICTKIITDYQEPYQIQEYVPYQGQELSPGVYYIKIMGHKFFGEGNVDFVPKILNTPIEELAWWNSTTLYGDGSDGELIFTTSTKSYGTMILGVDYTVSGDTLYLILNRPYQFTSVTIGSVQTVTTNNVSGSVLYIMAQDRITVQGKIDLSNRLNEGHRNLTSYVYLGDNFTTPGVADGGTGGGTTVSIQGMGYGGGGSGADYIDVAPIVLGGLGANGSYPFGIGGIANTTGCTGFNPNMFNGSNGTIGSAGGSGASYTLCIGGGGTATSGAGAGTYGAQGGNATSSYFGLAFVAGGGGGGGGGLAGKSGVHLVLKSKILNISSTAKFNTSGTGGGNGGWGGESSGTDISDMSTGYPGGGGGGGNSGSIYLFYSTLYNSSNQFIFNGGTGGREGQLKHYSDNVWHYGFAGTGTDGTSGAVYPSRAGGSYITLVNPVNGTTLVAPDTLYFNATVEGYLTNLINATFYLWNSSDTLINTSIKDLNGMTGLQNITFNVTNDEVPDNEYHWNVDVCSNDTANVNYCVRADNNFTFTTFTVTFRNTSYSNSTYEMFYEPYRINITSSGAFNITGQLIWNGVPYDATFGNVITFGTFINATLNASIFIPLGPGTKNFYWRVTYGGETKDSTNESVLINETFYHACNDTINVPYLNITYRDEISLNYINASVDQSTWIYNVSTILTSPFGKTYTYTNSTEEPSKPFCALPGSISLIIPIASYKYSSTGYSTKTWPFRSLSLTNTTTAQVLYMISLVDSGTSPVTFQVIDSITSTSQANARVSAYRDIAGTSTLIDDGYTDSAGSISYFMSPIYPYTILVTKSGCVPLSSTITPTGTLYNLIINCQSITNATQYRSTIDGLYYQRTPKDGINQPGTNTWFYYVNSTITNLTRVMFQIVDQDNVSVGGNDSLTNTAYCNPNSCLLSATITAYTGDNLKGRYYVGINGTDNSSLILLEGDAYWRFIAINKNGSLNIVEKWVNNFNEFLYEWGNGTATNCLPHTTQATCQADTSCRWIPAGTQGLENPICVARDDLNKIEFDRFVIIFFFLSLGLFIFGRVSGYELNHPGSFVIFMSGIIWIGSFYGLFSFSGLTMSDFLNQYIFALSTTLVSLGYGISIIRRYSQ